MDARGAGPGVAQPPEVDGSKDGFQSAWVQPSVGVQMGLPGAFVDAQGEAHRSWTSLLEVHLEEQALHFAPFLLLLALDLVQGELQGRRRSQPLLE